MLFKSGSCGGRLKVFVCCHNKVIMFPQCRSPPFASSCLISSITNCKLARLLQCSGYVFLPSSQCMTCIDADSEISERERKRIFSLRCVWTVRKLQIIQPEPDQARNFSQINALYLVFSICTKLKCIKDSFLFYMALCSRLFLGCCQATTKVYSSGSARDE